MSFQSCDMVYHATKDIPFMEFPMGHFYWAVDPTDGERFLWMKLPSQDGDPMGAACSIPVRPAADPSMPSWNWDGNLEKPTLTPSVFHDPNQPQSRYHWHGFITAGRMVGC